MLLVCLNKSSSTGQAIAAARHFAVNILGEGQADAAMRFAGKGDKFAGQRIVRGVAGAAAARGRAGQPRMPRRRGGDRRHALRLPRRGRARDGSPRRAARLLPRAVRPPRARAGRRGPPRHPRPGPEPRAACGRAAQPRRGRRAGGRPARLGLPRAHQAQRRGARHAHRRRPVRRDPAHRRVRVGRAGGAPRHRARRGRLDGRTPVGRSSWRSSAPRCEATRPAPQEQFDIDAHLDKYARFHEYFVGLAGSPALVDLHRRVNTASDDHERHRRARDRRGRLRARRAERVPPPRPRCSRPTRPATSPRRSR